tara:strand:+ start:132 stop:455 length:324 start_codon:yes stop_codon:yes gene_type:complete
MKLTESKLKQMVKEELEKLLEQEQLAGARPSDTEAQKSAPRPPESSIASTVQASQDPMAQLSAYMKKLDAADFSVYGHPSRQVESLKRAVVDLVEMLYNVISLSLRK